MALMPAWLRLATIFSGSMVLMAGAIDASPVKPVPIDLWVAGDDGLTLRLRGALEGALRSTPISP